LGCQRLVSDIEQPADLAQGDVGEAFIDTFAVPLFGNSTECVGRRDPGGFAGLLFDLGRIEACGKLPARLLTGCPGIGE
jgi:hypothetical protein